MSERCLVDTNILVRFFVGSPPEAAQRARLLMAKADAGEIQLEVLPLVLAETIFTLESFYNLPKSRVCDGLMEFLQSRGVMAHDPILLDALERYRSFPVHFVDAFLAATAAAGKVPVYSFDRDFARFRDVIWKQ